MYISQIIIKNEVYTKRLKSMIFNGMKTKVHTAL